MNTKLKALGLGFLAALAIIPFTATKGNAQVGGHFTIDVANPTLKTTESPTHRLEFLIAGFKGIVCEEVTYPGKFPQTFTELTIFGGLRKCATTGGDPQESEIRFNGCGVSLKIGKKAGDHNTTDIICPPDAVIEAKHAGCTVKVPEQAGLSGVSYTKIVEGGKDTITVQFTVGSGGPEVEAYFETGLCVLLGTAQTMSITGSLTVRAFDAAGTTLANITATGSED